MNEADMLSRMKAPGHRKPGKWGDGIFQILVTHSCDMACFGCTQGSNLTATKWDGRAWSMTVDQFREACRSLADYHGVVGMFGGNPALHKQFKDLCRVMREEIPFHRRGLWCNNPITVDNAREMAETFNPAVSNLNVHMSREAHDLFKEGWPGCRVFGLDGDSRHSPPWVAMKDLECLPVFDRNHRLIGEMPNTEENRRSLISDCDINQNWSPAIGVFRGQLRGWFCEIAMSQSIRHQNNPDYPDTGHAVEPGWWKGSMKSFLGQVEKHCHECGVPLRGHGELALNEGGKEQVSPTHLPIFKPKRAGRAVELVTLRQQLGDPLQRTTDYISNGRK